jgi:pyrimidine oxygenase
MDDCRLLPLPSVPMKLICAGQSAAGMAFTARWADYNFCLGVGFNTPMACAPTVARMQAAAVEGGRPISCYALFMIITGETDAEAQAKWEHYRGGVDTEAVAWMMQQGAADNRPNADTNVRQLTDAMQAVNLNIGALVGSYTHVAAMLDELAEIPGLAGVLLTFDEFVGGTEIFGTRIQPLMQSRRHISAVVEANA